MKISTINNVLKHSFKSLRTDKNEISTLKTGEMPILENKKENILASLNRLAQDPNRSNIEFLLDIAKDINYGQNGESEFKEAIDKSSDVAEDRENTDWKKLLADTIQQALKSSTDDISDLEARYGEIFNTKQPMTESQKEVLKLSSKVKSAVINENSLEDAEAVTRSAEISKKIDYFISSSEISIKQKQECLNKFLYLLSDEYPIVEQLKDKKAQVLNEMLDDMLIKIPSQKELTTKGVNQLYSGICAAISICRKAVAYEDKSRYVDIVLEELKDSDTMEVFDITELETDKKVKIPKIKIDYNSAIAQGYRILDASAHNWMQNAHSSGDGTIQSETYTAFDDDTFGIFNDTSWYEGFNPNLPQERIILKCLIKENELLDSVLKQKKDTKEASEKIDEEKQKTNSMQSKIRGELHRTFASIFSEMSEKDISLLINKLINFYKGTQDNNEVNISDKMPMELKQKITEDVIKQHLKISSANEAVNSELKSKSKKISELVSDYVKYDEDIKKLSSYSSKKSKYALSRKMFQLAAAHRMAVENDVNHRNGIIKFEKVSGLPTRQVQIISYLNSLQNDFENGNTAKLEHFSQGKNDEELQLELAEDILKINNTIPHTLDDISKTLFGKGIKEQLKESLIYLKREIKYSNAGFMEIIAKTNGIKPNKDDVISFLDKQIAKFSNDISERDIDEIVRVIGFADRLEFVKALYRQFLEELRNGIQEDEYKEIVARFGGEDKINSTIIEQQQRLLKTDELYESILARWEMPSQRQLIIEKMEKDNYILPYKKLQILKSRFDYILSQSKKYDEIENVKTRKKEKEKLYSFTPEELDILADIERALPKMKRYCKSTYKIINKELFDDLEDQYAKIGMLNGQFWVREEGNSGLSANEQNRIIEQMTGKPYHIEKDIEKAVTQVKEGNGSGIISTSVDDSSYAFHAQYAPSVTQEKISTQNEEKADVLWTDNSWGKAEKDNFWKGINGFRYTDYGSGYGWKNGFILADDLRIGLPVKEIKETIGYEKTYDDTFSPFTDMVLPGTPINAYQKLYKMFSNVLSVKNISANYESLEELLKKGEKLSIKELEGVDDLVSEKYKELKAQAEKIKTREDWDKLPENSMLKFVMNVLAVRMETRNPEMADLVTCAVDYENLEEIKREIEDDIISEMSGIIGKSYDTLEKLMLASYSDMKDIIKYLKDNYNVDLMELSNGDIYSEIYYTENKEAFADVDGSYADLVDFLMNSVDAAGKKYIQNDEARQYFTSKVKEIINRDLENYYKIKSLDSPMLKDSPVSELFIAAVDKYLKPTSDKDLIDLLAGFQYADDSQSDVFIDALKTEDLGLNFKDPYEFLYGLKVSDSSIIKAFYEIIANIVISNQLERDIASGNKLSTAKEFYRDLYIRLSDMDVQKYIKDFKEEAFRKYKVRQAFPEPVVVSDEKLGEVCNKFYKYLDGTKSEINSCDFIISIFEVFENIIEDIKLSSLNEFFIEGKDISNTSKAEEKDLYRIYTKLIDLRDKTEQDESFAMVQNPTEKLIDALTPQNGRIESQRVHQAYSDFEKAFNVWKASGVTKDRFRQTKKEAIEDIRSNLQILVDVNIIPKYRDEAYKMLNEIVTLTAKGNNKQELEYKQNQFINFFINRHLVKYPTKLLAECVKLAQQGKIDSPDYDLLKDYLFQALKIAQQTKIQYKLVENAHEGISTKTKDLLPMFNVTLPDGSKYSMASEIGMVYIVDQLENNLDGNKTLLLFLQQTGLSELALKGLINNFREAETKKVIDGTYDQIAQDIRDYAQLNSYIEKFLKQSKIPYSSFRSATNHLADFIKRKSGNADKEIYQNYIEHITAPGIVEQLNNGTKQKMIMPLLISLSKNATEEVTDIINQKIDFISNIITLLEDRKNLIEIIDVTENSEAFNERIEFRKRYDELLAYIYEKMNEISGMIEQADYLFDTNK